MLSEKEKQMVRVEKLAKRYGPFVRFFPDGTEGNDDPDGTKDGVLDSAIKDSEIAARTPEEQSQIDKARRSEQLLEQEKANTVRANEAERQARSDLESTKSEVETLKEQLTTAEAKAAEAGIKDVELKEDDYESESDRVMVRAINSLKDQVKAKDTRIVGLEKKATGYEQQAQKDEAIAARNTVYDELLTDLDAEYGADCRNEAVKQFQELTTAGKVPKGSPAKATRAMEKCYKEVKTAKDAKAKDSTKDKSSLTLDAGSGGGDTPSLSGTELKKGSLDDVATQFATAAKTG